MGCTMSSLYLYQWLAAEIRCFEAARCCGRAKILPNNLHILQGFWAALKTILEQKTHRSKTAVLGVDHLSVKDRLSGELERK